MSKEIILDGVNVAECRHLSFVEEDYCCDCQYEKYALCQNSDCYYKQLKRLQAENEELKKEINLYKNSIVANHDRAIGKRFAELLEENEELKLALKEIREICKCSKEMNCEECPQCDDCEELCTNDENLQDIITDKIDKVEE